MGADSCRDTEHARELFSSIVEECVRLTSMTGQLLSLSREDARIGNAPNEPIILNAVVQEAILSLRPLATTKRQELSLHVDAEPSLIVLADRQRLCQVFYNLIDNALKYTSPGGQITVTLTSCASEVIVEIVDNGVGIPAEHLPRIFNRFYRVKQGSGPDENGAGLGLSIVQSIVLSLGGRVAAESSPSEGSVFRVHLPVSRKQQLPTGSTPGPILDP